MNRNIKLTAMTVMLVAAGCLAPRVSAGGLNDLLDSVVGRYSAQPYNGQVQSYDRQLGQSYPGDYRVQPYSTTYITDYRSQEGYNQFGTSDIEQNWRSAASRINRGRMTGQLSQSEANQLSSMLQNIKQQAFGMHRSEYGIDQREQNQLSEQLANLNSRITNELSDHTQQAYRGHHYQLEHNAYNSHYANDNFDQGNTALWY